MNISKQPASTLNFFLVMILMLLQSCSQDEENNDPIPDYNSSGVYVVNEGGFNAGNASISYFDITTKTMSNNIFQSANGFPVGDVAQSMSINNGKGFIMVNNSQKVEVVNLSDFHTITTIGGFSGPRYMVTHNNKGYVSDWFSNQIKVIDLNSNAIIKTIPTGEGPEKMCITGSRLFVANCGGYNSDSTVSIINTGNDSLLLTVQVGLNPNSVATDLNGVVWVLCGGSTGPDFTGGTADDIEGSVWSIEPLGGIATLRYTFLTSQHPVKMVSDGPGRYMYFLNGTDGYTGKIWVFDAVPVNISPYSVVSKFFYGLGVDPGSGMLYGGTAPDFQQNGKLFRYSSSGILADSTQAGIAPNSFVFKN